jgi:hypothetical protein
MDETFISIFLCCRWPVSWWDARSRPEPSTVLFSVTTLAISFNFSYKMIGRYFPTGCDQGGCTSRVRIATPLLTPYSSLCSQRLGWSGITSVQSLYPSHDLDPHSLYKSMHTPLIDACLSEHGNIAILGCSTGDLYISSSYIAEVPLRRYSKIVCVPQGCLQWKASWYG